MTNTELKKLLDHGDYVKIARMVGYKDLKSGRRYVYEVMSGKRKSNKGKGKKIIEAAKILALRNTENGIITTK